MLMLTKHRSIALERGFTLNEYEICPIDDNGTKKEPLVVHSEQDIFDIIGLEYRLPFERDL